jgi:hypothetical protein
LQAVDLARMVLLRQGLWIEDGQTPPGQECSNGSLIPFAAVSWRTFLQSSASLRLALIRIKSETLALL